MEISSSDMISDECNAILFDFSKKIRWQYGWQSRRFGDRFSYWHKHFCGGDINEKRSCEFELNNEILQPIRRLWFELSGRVRALSNYYPVRIYANAHTYGNEGYLHKDHDKANQSLTVIYYAHSFWAINWTGETIFYDDSYNSIKSVYPKPGRVVIFPGDIPHVARSPSREATELRISIVFKLMDKRHG